MEAQEFNELQEKEKAFLDTIDLTLFLEKGKDVYDMMCEIEDQYNDGYKDEECIFSCMNTYDFVVYLRNRYPNIHISEIIVPHYEIF